MPERSMSERLAELTELRHFLVPRRPILNPTKRRLARAMTVSDLREAAAKQVPRAVFDYTDGAAEQEVSIERAKQYLRDLVLVPRVLTDVSQVDTSRTLFGTTVQQPFVLAPTGFSRMMHSDGETAVVRAAQRHGVVYTLSTMGTTSIEDVARAAPGATRWFQLYVSRERSVNQDLLRRARANGYTALVLTVDVPVGGMRLRDVRNGFSFPPRLRASTYLDGIRRPGWTKRFLTTPPLGFASLGGSTSTLASHMSQLFDPAVTMDDFEWMREAWDGPLVVKGVQSLPDAVRLADAGVDGIVLSNHGGRQLDRAPVPLALLPHVVQAVGGRTTIGIDTGFLTGADVAAAVALGADFVMIGRAYLYGLMAGGEAGVDRVLDILADELRRSMQLLGANSLDGLTPAHVQLPPGVEEQASFAGI